MESQIILCRNINIDKEYTNVLNYTENQMVSLCRANAIAVANNYSFLRTTGTIFVGFTYSQCIGANYIAFQNPDYSNKWFFAWIDEVIYKSDKNCELVFTIDAWSTWFDYWTPKKCFINRQHVTDDTVGLHTVPENLDVGDVIEEEYEEILNFGPDGNYYYYAISGTYNPISRENFTGVNKVNGNLMGTWIFLFDAYAGDFGIPAISNFLTDVNRCC